MAAWVLVSTNTSVAAGNDYLVNALTPVYITLPGTPQVGDQVQIADGTTTASNTVIIVPNGRTIEGSGSNLPINQSSYQISLVYNGSTWKKYNLTAPQVKITELDEIQTASVSNNDLMVFVDSETLETNKIKFSTIRSSVTSGFYSNTTLSTLVSNLNTYTTANSQPRLNTRLFDGQTSSFYRNYNNLTNRPTIPTRTSQLINDGNVANGSPFITSLSTFTTNQLTEGSTNWYFTNSRFDARLDARFPELFRLYSNEFEESSVIDSEISVPATPVTTVTATNTISLSAGNIVKFTAGQAIRIFGANVIDNPITTTPSITDVVKNGLTGATGNYISYRLAEFDLSTGKISIAGTASSTAFIGTNTLNSFNNTNNIELTFTRSSSNYGILVYRSYNGSTYNLIDILGSKELGPTAVSGIVYRDFANFNNNPWTGKNNRGEYTVSTGIIHMPVIAPESVLKGWVDAVISNVDTTVNRITLSAAYYMSPSLTICHNDTAAIQTAVNARVSAGINSLTLNDRRYVVSSVVLPAAGQFTFSGKGRQTVLYKLPWSTETHNKMIYTPGFNTQNISVTNLNIDGNMQNQWQKYDGGNDTDANYTLSFTGQNINVDKVYVDNIVGGGLYSPQPSKLTINLCRFENSGMSDFFAYSPLYAPEGDDVIITNNVFRNFSDSLDLNTTDNGILSSNFIENTGSGALVFGSRFFISSPNVIKGPAGEFIPTPDVFNSEYDSVNITLEPGTSYLSPVFTYQENGNLFDLTANQGQITYRIDKLGKFDNQEVLYGQLPNYAVDVVGPDKSQGQFRFSISTANVDILTSTYSYPVLKAANTAHVGLVYRAILSESVPSGTVVGSGTVNPDGLGNDKYRVTLENYSNLAVGRIIRFANHGGTIGANTLNNTDGEIISILENTAPVTPQAFVTIDYTAPVTSAGNGGTLNIKNEFVIVKGRIQ